MDGEPSREKLPSQPVQGFVKVLLGRGDVVLAADRGEAVPVVLGDELVGLPKVKWDGLHTSIYGGSPIIPCRSGRER